LLPVFLKPFHELLTAANFTANVFIRLLGIAFAAFLLLIFVVWNVLLIRKKVILRCTINELFTFLNGLFGLRRIDYDLDAFDLSQIGNRLGCILFLMQFIGWPF